MRVRRGESPRRKMVNYTHVLVGALSLTSLILLVKYRNLSTQMYDESMTHIMTKKALQDELMGEASSKKQLEANLQAKSQDISKLNSKFQESQNELTNSVRAVQAGNDKIETLKIEGESINQANEQLKQENEDFQIQITSLQEEIKYDKDQLLKTNALADDIFETLKRSQEKQEQLISENQELTKQIEDFKSLQGKTEYLKSQLQAALDEAKDTKGKLSELESKAQETIDKPKQNEPEKLATSNDKAEKDTSDTGKLDGKKAPTVNGDGLEDYDMLEEDEKEKMKKELQADGGEAVKASGEVVDDAAAAEEGVLKDNVQGEVVDEEKKVEEAADKEQLAEGEGGASPDEGVPSARKAVEAAEEELVGSFGMDQKNALSSSDGSISYQA